MIMPDLNDYSDTHFLFLFFIFQNLVSRPTHRQDTSHAYIVALAPTNLTQLEQKTCKAYRQTQSIGRVEGTRSISECKLYG